MSDKNHSCTCHHMFEGWLFPYFVFFLSRASLSHCLLVLCPAHQLPCGRNRRGIKPLHSRTMRSIAPWRCLTLSQAKGRSVARQLTCQKIADPKKPVHSKLATSWQRQDASRWQASIGTPWRSEQCSCRNHRIHVGIDLCAAVTVSQECCGRLSDKHARQSEELQTSVRQASSRSGCAKSKSSSERGLSDT